MNQIVLLGRLTKDPEMRYTPNGTAVARFTVAVPRDNSDKTDFIHCNCFGKLAENTAQYCKKGRQILLSGRLEINTRKNEVNNQYDSFTTVIANKIDFLAKPMANNGQSHSDNPHQNANNHHDDQHQQQRFQTTHNGWVNPSDVDQPF